MKALKIGTVLLAITAMAALAPGAGATEFVPPENSAASQYTESFPSAGGNHNVQGTGGDKHRSPAETLGQNKTHRLQEKGQEGQAAAELAAATAPTQSVAKDSTGGSNATGQGRQGKSAPSQTTALKSGPHSASSGEENVSSGASQILGQATGTSTSGQISWLLPVIIAAALAWALAFFWRRRRTTA